MDVFYGCNNKSLQYLPCDAVVTTNIFEAELYGRYIFKGKIRQDATKALVLIGVKNDYYGLHFRYRLYRALSVVMVKDQLG